MTRKVEEIFSPYEFCLSKVAIYKIKFKIFLYLYFDVLFFEEIAIQQSFFISIFCGGV